MWDDNSINVSRPSALQLSETLFSEYKKIAEYMSANKLVINDDKSHVMVFCKKSLQSEREKVCVKSGDFEKNRQYLRNF